jgi:hypothetical protein
LVEILALVVLRAASTLEDDWESVFELVFTTARSASRLDDETERLKLEV